MTLNDRERRNGPYFALFHRIRAYDVVVKQLLGLPRFQNLLLIVRSAGGLDGRIHFNDGESSSGLTTWFDGRRCLALYAVYTMQPVVNPVV